MKSISTMYQPVLACVLVGRCFFLKIDTHLGAAEILPMGWNVGAAHCRHVRGISRDSLGSGIAPRRAIESALASFLFDTIARDCYVVLFPIQCYGLQECIFCII